MNTQNFAALKERSISFRSETAEARIERLIKLQRWLTINESEILESLKLDFNKPHFETLISEVLPTIKELKYTLKNLKKWMKSKSVRTPLALLGHSSWIRYENKGVVLIISPWNYPFMLAAIPLIAALASGNTVVIKPSELTPHTSDLIKKMVENCFYSNEVYVELGDKEKTQELLHYRFDHVFFTGSTQVGKIVAKACAENLIPTTLELGGKSPLIIDETVDLDFVVEKIFWSKFLNRGQTCVAPDFALVHASIADVFSEKLNKHASQFNETNKATIITEQHHHRLQKMIGTKIDLNKLALQTKFVESFEDPLMREEIFGPILPILRYKTESELFSIAKQNEKPLALYIFSKNNQLVNNILEQLPSGGVGINSVIVQLGNHNLPFGGVGHSGSGEYHGYFGFIEMSHQRAVIKQSYLAVLGKLIMPPYVPIKRKVVDIIKKM
jgi:aldehyde dehydrogenase (NAD+)